VKNLNELSKSALSAAMRGGTEGWGEVGSSQRHIRYREPMPKRPGNKKNCWCGCGGKVTHRCMANGVCLGSACEFGAARWVRTGFVKFYTKPL
jgi:hypothetical protein